MVYGTNLCIESERIEQIFHNMSYGNKKSVESAKKWLSDRQHKFSSLPIENLEYIKINTSFYDEDILISKFNNEDAENFLNKMKNRKTKDIDHIQRSRTLKKLSTEMKKNINLIGELALITQGIDINVSKTIDMPIICDYLEYYASISYSTTYNHLQWSPYENVLVIIPNQNTISSLVLAFAPAFAAGCKIILIVEAQLAPIGFLFVDICKKSGVPDGYLDIVCSGDRYGTGQIYLQKDEFFNKVTYIGDIQGGKTLKYSLGGFPRNLSLLIKSKCSMIIHNDADIYSACDAIIEGAWSHYGLLPWNLYSVYVQESIYESFIDILKKKMNSINLDVFHNTPNLELCNNYCSVENLHKLINKSAQFGVDYYQPATDVLNEGSNKLFLPTILYGAQITDDDDFTPVVTVLPYRNITEAISLANNTKYGLAVSVWSESESLIKEIYNQLQTSLVWINCYGLVNPQTSLCPYKESGLGYFGGMEGLLNYMHLDGNSLKPYNVYESPGKIDSIKSDEVCAKVSKSKKAFQIWSKYSALERCKHLLKLADEIENNGKLAQVENWWVHILYEYSTKGVLDETTSFVNKISLTTLKEPLGVIVIDAYKDMDLIAQLVIFAITNGNAVLLVVKDIDYLSEICKLFTLCGFPENLFTVVTNNSYLKQLIEHEDIQSYWYETSTNDLDRFNRARHIDWRATYNLKKSFIYEADHTFDDTALNMISSRKKSILGYYGNSITV